MNRGVTQVHFAVSQDLISLYPRDCLPFLSKLSVFLFLFQCLGHVALADQVNQG